MWMLRRPPFKCGRRTQQAHSRGYKACHVRTWWNCWKVCQRVLLPQISQQSPKHWGWQHGTSCGRGKPKSGSGILFGSCMAIAWPPTSSYRAFSMTRRSIVCTPSQRWVLPSWWCIALLRRSHKICSTTAPGPHNHRCMKIWAHAAHATAKYDQGPHWWTGTFSQPMYLSSSPPTSKTSWARGRSSDWNNRYLLCSHASEKACKNTWSTKCASREVIPIPRRRSHHGWQPSWKRRMQH